VVPTEIAWPIGNGSLAQEQIAAIPKAMKTLTIPKA
jgi:hypothetical protein